MPELDYEPLYLRGIDAFNRRNYFDSHEIWEELWLTETGPSRLFYKGLIQAAVALYHAKNGNRHGAAKLLATSQGYLSPYRPRHLGLDLDRFLDELSLAVTTVSALPPVITLEPTMENDLSRRRD